MAKAKVSQWMGQLRDMGRVLRLNFPSIDKARWSLSWIEVSYFGIFTKIFPNSWYIRVYDDKQR